MKRNWVKWLCAVAVVGTLCTGMAIGASAEDKEVRVWLGSWWDGEVEWMTQKFAEDNPGYTLSIELQPIANYQDNATSAILGGSGPDVLSLDTLFLPAMMDQGLLQPLDDFAAENGLTEDKFVDTVYDAGRTEDALYAIPYRFTCTSLYYNKTMFDEAGVEYPTDDITIDGLCELSAQLTKDGKYGFGIAASKNDMANVMTSFVPFLWGEGGDFVNEDITAGTMSTPESIEGIKKWVGLYLDGSVPEGCINYAITADLFPLAMSGEIAMIPMGDSNIVKIDEFAQENGFEWGVCLHPGLVRAAGWSFTIPSSIEDRDGAETFIKWFMQPEILSMNNTVLPALKEAQNMGKWGDELYDIYKKQADQCKNAPQTLAWTQIQLIVTEELQNALSGSVSCEDAAAAMDERINEVLG